MAFSRPKPVAHATNVLVWGGGSRACVCRKRENVCTRPRILISDLASEREMRRDSASRRIVAAAVEVRRCKEFIKMRTDHDYPVLNLRRSGRAKPGWARPTRLSAGVKMGWIACNRGWTACNRSGLRAIACSLVSDRVQFSVLNSGSFQCELELKIRKSQATARIARIARSLFRFSLFRPPRAGQNSPRQLCHPC